MRVGIDARMLNESGIGRYIRNLIANLEKLDQENEYFIFISKPYSNRLVYHSKKFHKVLANFRWYTVSEQIKLPSLLNHYQLDLVHFPHFNVPIFYQGKFVVTIHDLIHQHYQMRRATSHDPLFYQIKKIGYNLSFKNAINKSQKVLVPSQFIKNQLINEWQVDENKIVVTHEAVDDQIITQAKKWNHTKGQKMLSTFNIKPPYIFYVGNAHPHKNVEGLIRAFLKIRQDYQYLQLALSGSDHYFWQRIKTEFQHKDIVYTGFVTDEQLVALYKGASCFVMPSFEEGFGIPLLEAMACECPVVSSTAGALPEVGGDAAIYFDPHPFRHPERSEGSNDVSDMIDKITQVLNSERLRKELVARGLIRYKQFSWQKLAKQTLSVYSNYAN